MDATFRPRHFSAELFAYAENKKIFEIFQNMLEKITTDRPTTPMEYLYDLLTKEAVYDVPKVYALGPPSADRTLLCTVLALKLGLMLIAYENLLEEVSSTRSDSLHDRISLVKKRLAKPDCARKGWILDGFPTTRNEAFLLRKNGVFPTHIALIEPHDFMDMTAGEMSEEIQTYLAQKALIIDFHRSSHLKEFIVDTNTNEAVERVIEFVRARKHPPMPYLPRVLVLGPYGSGRKTAVKKLVEKYHLREIDFQQELRRAAMKESPLKKRICAILKTSSPIPDDLLVNIASERLLQKDCIESGWIMYNFPDTPKQAELLVKALEGFQINRAVFLHATLENCLSRVEPRRLDPSTGKTYHLNIDLCKEKKVIDRLIQLPQDQAESVEAEHTFYNENLEDMKVFFQQNLSDDITVEIDANGSKEDIFEALQATILQSSKMKLIGA